MEIKHILWIVTTLFIFFLYKRKESLTKNLGDYLIIIFLIICWVIFLSTLNNNYDKSLWLYPRSISSLYEIFTTHFVHSNLKHITSNTIYILIYFLLIYLFFDKKQIPKLLLFSILFVGVFVFIFGEAITETKLLVKHGGASGILYSFRTYIIFSGLLNHKDKTKLAIAITVLLSKFTTIFIGIIPNDIIMSWEAHLGGTIAAIIFVLYEKFYSNNLQSLPFLGALRKKILKK